MGKEIDSSGSEASASAGSLPKGIHFQHDKKSVPSCWYIYPWRGSGILIAKIVSETKPSLNKEQIAEIKRHIDLKNYKTRGVVNPRDESTPLKWLIEKWRSDADWKEREPSTQRTWGYELENIDAWGGHLPLMLFYHERTHSKVVEWRNKRRGAPRSADIGITVLRQLLKFGQPLVGSTVDITKGIKPLYKANARPDIIWTDAEIERFIKIAHEQNKPELADVLRLAALTGMRRASLITVKNGHVRDEVIVKRARKVVRGRQRLIAIPTFGSLAQLLRELRQRKRKPGVRNLLTNASGEKWDADHLTHQFGIIRDLANIKHLDRDTLNRKPRVIMKTLHDVRGTFATKLMTETDLSDSQVAKIMGWDPRKVENIRRAYVRNDAYMQSLGARIRRQGA